MQSQCDAWIAVQRDVGGHGDAEAGEQCDACGAWGTSMQLGTRGCLRRHAELGSSIQLGTSLMQKKKILDLRSDLRICFSVGQN